MHTLLIIDGSTFIARLVSKCLQGWDITVASDVDSALHNLSERKYDRLLINCYPPQMEGLRIVRGRLHTINSTTPTFVLAGQSATENEEAKRLGAVWVKEFADFPSSDEFIRAINMPPNGSSPAHDPVRA